jgi:hypothetical protein
MLEEIMISSNVSWKLTGLNTRILKFLRMLIFKKIKTFIRMPLKNLKRRRDKKR